MRGIARRAIGSRKWSSGWRCGRRPIFLLSTSNVSNKFVVVVIAIAIIVVVAVVIICIVVLRGGGRGRFKERRPRRIDECDWETGQAFELVEHAFFQKSITAGYPGYSRMWLDGVI